MSKSTPRLGKGLSALITPRAAGPFRNRAAAANVASSGETPSEGMMLRSIALDRIQPNPHQPRQTMDDVRMEELAASIRQSGILQPILLRAAGAGKYELIAGERRWRAAAKAGLDAIPAIVRDLSDSEAFETALVENLQREDLTPLERATAYQQLVDTLGVGIDAVAARLGESRANVSNYLRLLKLSDEVLELVGDGALGMGQARAIAGISNPQRQLAIARLAVRRNLSARQVEALAKDGVEEAVAAQRERPAKEAHFAEIEQTLSKSLGLSVKLQPGKKKNAGRVTIRYESLEEFDRIAEKIVGRSLLE